MNYEGALRTATEAALAAGEVLRREFHRPGGPRGEIGHAPVDTEAERIIRGSLCAAFPDWSYLGEETGAQRGSDAQHCWLVDPNDGTALFQRGQRGSAVSIGLVREGIPVLGVVHAYCAPDDRGDLFTWAEDCGPLQRNGSSVQAAFPEKLEAHSIVLLAPGAESVARANLEAVAPARFRALPSIAYRLALAAAGEGVAAISIHNPGAWDYGGGHALLRGVGGEFVNERGQTVSYSLAGGRLHSAVLRRWAGHRARTGTARLAARA